MAPYKPKNSPYYHYDFWIGDRRYNGSCKTENFEQAKAIEAQKRTEAVTGSRPPSSITIGQAFGTYFQNHARHRKSHKDILAKLNRIAEGLGSDKQLFTVSNRDIAAYVGDRREEVSNASVNRELALTRAAFKYCETRLDVAAVKINWKDHMLDEPRERVRCLSADEEKRLLQNIRSDFHPLIAFCLLTGARLSSAIRLTWADIRDGNMRLKVKSKKHGDFHDLPVSDDLQELLDGCAGHHPIYVFTYICDKGRKGRKRGDRYPFSSTGWRREWARALKAAKVTDFRFHDLRHTAASRILKQEKNIFMVKQVLGHHDINSTMRYAHADKEDLKRALSRKIPEDTASDGGKDKKSNIVSMG